MKRPPSNGAQAIAAAQGALERLTAAVTSFHTPRPLKPNAGSEHPATLAKVLATLTESLSLLRRAAAHFDSGGPRVKNDADFRAVFSGFLEVYAALKLVDQVGEVDPRPAFEDGRKLMLKKMDEIWALAPSFLGEAGAAKLEAERLVPIPNDLAPTRAAATKLNRFIRGGASSENATVRRAWKLLNDVGLEAHFSRQGGKYALSCDRGTAWWLGPDLRAHASGRHEKGRPSRTHQHYSLDEVASAIRTALEHLGLDSQLPVVLSRPSQTEQRLEEAWSLLHHAFEVRDFIAVPQALDPYAMRRWETGSISLEPPATGFFKAQGGFFETRPGLYVVSYSNDRFLSRSDHPSFKEGTPERLASDLRGYLAQRGLGDVWLEVKTAHRPLSEAHAGAIRDRLEAVRSSATKPAPGTPEALLKDQVSEIRVEQDPYSKEREVVVEVPGSSTGYYGEPLLRIEEAVRAILSDDPTTIGTRIRIKLDPQADALGRRPEGISVLFGKWETPEEQARVHTQAAAADDRFAPSLKAYALERRLKGVERFAAAGQIQAELVAQMEHDPNEHRSNWQDPLAHNLAAWFLGQGAADPSWSQRFEQLPLSERADFLELSLEFLKGAQQAPGLLEALTTFRRLAGRLELERACTQNGAQSPAQMAHTDAVLSAGLAGPAKEAAWSAIALARQP
ncbi:MAG: hypothetical protein IPG45_25335 [Deltaproteobacteria bacterium]|nr:hypothetical protein [Deltaproteobacteria bacterium]